MSLFGDLKAPNKILIQQKGLILSFGPAPARKAYNINSLKPLQGGTAKDKAPLYS